MISPVSKLFSPFDETKTRFPTNLVLFWQGLIFIGEEGIRELIPQYAYLNVLDYKLLLKTVFFFLAWFYSLLGPRLLDYRRIRNLMTQFVLYKTSRNNWGYGPSQKFLFHSSLSLKK